MTAATTTLADFLLQRIAEDEAAARAARHDYYSQERWRLGTPSGRMPSLGLRRSAEHIARHDPARVLADLEAHRRIVELHYPVPASDIDWTDCGTCPSSVSGGWPCPTLRALALPYADHPSYREEWRP